MDRLYLAVDRESLLKRVEEQRIGRTFGEQLLWLAFLLMIVEFSYANMLQRSGNSLTGKLGIDLSGKMGGTGV